MALKETQNLPIAYGNGETLSKELERVLGHGNFELKQVREDSPSKIILEVHLLGMANTPATAVQIGPVDCEAVAETEHGETTFCRMI